MSIGSSAAVLPVNICGNFFIGAGAAVTKSITIAGTYVGSPARKVKYNAVDDTSRRLGNTTFKLET